MNSMSKKYYDSCEKHSYEKEEKCPTIIKCGCPSSVSLPIIAANVGVADVTLSSVTVDTSCICDPVVKLDFTSAFSSLAAVAIGGVNIQIYKQCKGQSVAIPVGPSWPVVGGLTLAVGNVSYISLFVCDGDNCSGDCCTYTAVATVRGTIAAAISGAFNNSTLSATVSCKSNSCKRKCIE